MPNSSNPTQGSAAANALGWYQNAQGNIVNTKAGGIVTTPTGSSVAPATAGSSGSSGPANTYATVVSSRPAASDISAITADYQNNIQPAMQQQAQKNQQNQQTQNQLPVVPGYTVSTTQTKAPGEISVTSSGQTYYAVPPAPKTDNSASVASNIVGGGAPTGTTGTTGTNPTSTGSISPSMNASGIDLTSKNANYNTQIGQVNTDLDNAYQSFNDAVKQITTGVFPLTGAQQALIDSTSQAFDNMMSQQQLRSAALSSATGGISTKINATLGDISNIETEKVAAVAKLEQGFQTQDYNMIKDSYDAYTKAEQTKTDLLTKMHDDVVSQYNAANDLALKIATFNQTEYKNEQELAQSAYEFRDKMDAFGNKIGTEVYLKSDPTKVLRTTYNGSGAGSSDPTAGVLNPVQIGADGTPDPTQQAQFLATIPSAYRDLVQQVANYNKNPATLSPKAKTQIESWASSYNPNYDEKNYATAQAVQKDYTSGSASKNIIALNTAVGHIGDLAQNFKNLPNSDLTKYNTLADWVSSNLGQGAVTKVATDLNALTGELAATFKNSGATDQEISNIKAGININSSPAQYQAFIEEASKLLGSRLSALNQTYANAIGQPFPRSFLNPSANSVLSNLKSQGYNIQVDGVKSPVASQIETATKAGYSSQDIVNKLSTDPTYGSKIQQAISQGISPDDILKYLQNQ